MRSDLEVPASFGFVARCRSRVVGSGAHAVDIYSQRCHHVGHHLRLQYVGEYLGVESSRLVAARDGCINLATTHRIGCRQLGQQLEERLALAPCETRMQHLELGHREVEAVGQLAARVVFHRRVFIVEAQSGRQRPSSEPCRRLVIERRAVDRYAEIAGDDEAVGADFDVVVGKLVVDVLVGVVQYKIVDAVALEGYG